MSAAAPDLSDIDAAIAKGEWWLRLLEELAESGVALAGELAPDVKAGRIDGCDAADLYVRISAAVRQAIALSMRLEQALRGLRALRACTAQEIADARARARAQAEADIAAREKARAAAKARREARKEQVRELVMEVIDREATDRADHENLSLALEQRLSFDPAYTDIDSLPLRETVERICADLMITPDWSRWQAGGWKPRDPAFGPDRRGGEAAVPRPREAPPTALAANTGPPLGPAAPARLE
jgi:hypothetical protein